MLAERKQLSSYRKQENDPLCVARDVANSPLLKYDV